MATVLSNTEMFFGSWEPKQANRWQMLIQGIPAALIHVAQVPSWSSDEVKLPHINTERFVKGKTHWNDLNITIFDPITPSGAQSVYEWVRLAYEAISGRAGYLDMYQRDLTLQQLGPVGDIVSEWTIKGAWIKSIQSADLNWDSGGQEMNINLTLRYNYAILEY